MTTHLRLSHPQERLGGDPSRDEILSHFTVTLADLDAKPPSAA